MRARGPRAVLALLITGAAAALGVGAMAAAAHAAPSAGGCGLNPCVPSVVVNGIDADGTVHVTYTEESASTLGGFDSTSIAATISWAPVAKPAPGAPVPNPTSAPLENPVCSGVSPMTCTFSFPAGMKVNGYVLNGTYTVKATGTDCAVGTLDCTAGASDPTSVSLANPPTAPTAVKAVAQGPTVKISWTASPEPDVVGYQVLRGDGTVACSLSTFPVPTEYSCVDTPTKDGSYTYHVVAHRWGPTYSESVKDQPGSNPNDPLAASKPVSVTGTSANTTTTNPGGAGTLGPRGFVPVLTPKKGSTPAGPTIRLTPNTGPAIGAATATTADPGFAPTLPYNQPPPQDPATTNPSAISAPAAPHKGKTSTGTIAVVGAGLLIAVIALHGLWLRSEVRRVPILEVLDPEH